MKRHEQALLLLQKAAQDESLLDQVMDSDKVSDVGDAIRERALYPFDSYAEARCKGRKQEDYAEFVFGGVL